MSGTYDELQILRRYTELNESILEHLTLARTTEEAQEYLNMLEGLAIHENAPSVAKAMYGLSYLMEGKPWYNFELGFKAVNEAADGNDPLCSFILASLYLNKPWYNFELGFKAVNEAADGNDPLCWFILGSLYLNGKPNLQRDLISAKYWLGRAANEGLKEAISIYDLEWGDNPEGFKDYVKSGEMEKDIWRKYYFKMILVGLGLIGAIALVLYGLGVFG